MELDVLPQQLQRSFMIAGSLLEIPVFFISAKEHIKSMSYSCLLMTLKSTQLVKTEASAVKKIFQNTGPEQK